MIVFIPDTSCLIAASCSWHHHHAAATRALDRRLAQGQTLVLAASTLLESFAVLTGLPAPRRLSPKNARLLLEQNFAAQFDIVSLDGARYGQLLEQAEHLQAAGGSVYDLLIAECAREAGARAIITFNARHFERFVSSPMEVEVPE